MVEKICSPNKGCGKSKPLDQFNKRGKGSKYFESVCKEYKNIYTKRNYEKKCSLDPSYRRSKSLKSIKRSKERYKEDKDYRDKVLLDSKKWRDLNRGTDEDKLKRRIYYNNKIKNDPNFKLSKSIRSRIRAAITRKNRVKPASAIEELGCTIEECRKHIESQFQEGMNWDNHGEWHIDHIKPLASFNLENIEEFKEACHYTNLQPLWAEDNLKKWKN